MRYPVAATTHRNRKEPMPIPLPYPFLVIPGDGSDPVYIHEAPQELQTKPLLGVAYVTPYIAQKWLHAGQPVFYPVVVLCEADDHQEMVAGQRFLREAVAHHENAKPAAVVKLGDPQATVACSAVAAMRMATQQPESDDAEAIILSADGVVLGGAAELYELRKPKVMLVLIIEPAPGSESIAAAPFN